MRGKSTVTHGCGVWRKGSPAADRFDNAVLRELPVDPEPKNFVRTVSGACFSRVAPTPIANPQLVIASRDALKLAGIDVWRQADESGVAKDELVSVDELTPFLAGNVLFPGSETAAQCYCGHQFGYFSGQLGDGAAIYLGEVLDSAGERWEVQLKGAGLTPFSRTADGRKVLRSTLREFLASEHMHALGVPTTRAASVVMSHDTTVVRDMFYDGNPQREPTAVVMRIARSFLRFGSFELFKDTDAKSGRRGPSAGLPNRRELMQQMLDFAIRQYFPAIHAGSVVDGRGGSTEVDATKSSTTNDASADAAEDSVSRTSTTATSSSTATATTNDNDNDNSKNDSVDNTNERKYVQFFAEVVQRTARLVAKWQSLGFCHGVLNTDNMSVVGDTLDYGPFGFMEHFDPDHVCNTSDDSGRYRYAAQPEICRWNLSVLADQLALVVDRTALEPALDAFDATFADELAQLMRGKLGLVHKRFPREDRALVDALFDVLAETGADFTCAFRALADVQPFDDASQGRVVNALVQLSESAEQREMRRERMARVATSAAHGSERRDSSGGFPDVPEATHHSAVRAAWSNWLRSYVARVKRESDDEPDVAYELHRDEIMRRANPTFVLRTHVLEKAVEYAASGQLQHFEHVFDLLTHPFDVYRDQDGDRGFARPQHGAP